MAKQPTLRSIWRLMFLLTSFGSLLAGRGAVGQDCKPISPALKQTVATYVQRQYAVPQVVGLHITDISRVGDTCYQKITLDASSGARRIEVYLTPDEKYLTTRLMDLSQDPLAESLRLEHDTLMALVEGTPPSRGPADAPVTLVEFADFQCPYCAQLADTLSKLPAGDAGKVRVIFHHLPLPIHSWAREAAMISVCVDLQGNTEFWKLNDFIYTQQPTLTAQNVMPQLLQFIKDDLQINPEAINACLDQHKYEDTLAHDEQLAKRFSVRVTPTVFVNGRKCFGYCGPVRATIEEALASAQQKPESAATSKR